MAMKPRARRSRPNPPRSRSGPPPSDATDPRRPRRRPDSPGRRPEPGPVPGPEAAPTLATLEAVIEDFTRSWDRGERPRAERYLGLLPASDSAELIYHEYCLAEAADLAPDPAEYLRRFPDQARSLGRLFALHGALSASTLREWAAPAELPAAGDEIGPYRLLRELGRGAFARVFLAEQSDLDHRLVVLKVAGRPTAEPRLLARASHAHIVEVLRQAEADDGALHLVCMPFLGGATLSAVLDARRKLGRRPRSGLDLLADLDRVAAPEYPATGLARPAREIISGLSYPQALAWIVARLAEALDHAHRQGVAHGDLKPSNVLLAADGSPKLFDFNLAVDRREAAPGGTSADLGGTLAYMAPERLRSVAEGGERPGSKPTDLHRADLYALGLLLLEALTGRAPEAPRGRPDDLRALAGSLAGSRGTPPSALRGLRARAIPPALRSILARCLAPDPADRYARGDELAEDLDRWRRDRRLAFADEPRRSDLIRRARRGRLPLIGAAMTLAVAAAVGLVASAILRGSDGDRAEDKYGTIVGRDDSGAFGLRRFGHWRGDELGDPVDASARQLARYNVLGDPEWRDRDDVRSLPERERGELEAWIFEQILRHAVALKERPESPGDWRRALALLDRTLARASSGPIEAERLAVRARLSLHEIGPRTAGVPRLPRWMDDYLAGVAAEALHAREALGRYTDALQGRPGMFWASYRAAVVACRIGEYTVEARHLRDCVRRQPENPTLHILLASALYYVERETPERYKSDPLADALAECDLALKLDPDFAPGYRVRAQIRKDAGLVEGARSDLERYAVLSRFRGRTPVLSLELGLRFHPGPNYVPLSVDGEAMSRQILAVDPDDYDHRAVLAASLAHDHRTAEALSEFDRVLEADPDHLRARYQRAVELYKDDRGAAIPEFASLIDHPRLEELFREEPAAIRAFHYVANDLLDRGEVAEALEVAGRGFAHATRSRSLQDEAIFARRKAANQVDLSPLGESYYQLARIHARAEGKDRGDYRQAVAYLDRSFAISSKFRDRWFARDALFNGMRGEILGMMKSRTVDR